MAMVLVVRHGQASFGADDYDVLSEVGWEQGRRLGARLGTEGVVPAVVVRGAMRRHRETAQALLEGLRAGRPDVEVDVEVDDRWDEFDHLGVVAAHPDLAQGGTASLDRRAFQRVFVESTRRWALDEDETATAYPETFGAFAARSRAALAQACVRAADGVVVVVSSGGPIGLLAADLVDPGSTDRAGLARRWERFNTVCVNAAVTRVLVGSTGTRLLTFNDHAHLDRELTTYR